MPPKHPHAFLATRTHAHSSCNLMVITTPPPRSWKRGKAKEQSSGAPRPAAPRQVSGWKSEMRAMGRCSGGLRADMVTDASPIPRVRRGAPKLTSQCCVCTAVKKPSRFCCSSTDRGRVRGSLPLGVIRTSRCTCALMMTMQRRTWCLERPARHWLLWEDVHTSSANATQAAH